MVFSVPAIDISPYVSGSPNDAEARARVAAQFAAACRDVGFVQVHGHGIPEEIMDGLAAASDSFFVGLEQDEKKRYQTPPGINRGYSPPKSEATSLSLGVEPANKMNDFFEAFNVGLTIDDYDAVDLLEEQYQHNVWPDVPLFRERVEAYLQHARAVSHTLMTLSAEALGLPGDFFEAAFAHATGTMRMNNYALTPGMNVTLDGELRGMGEHTDFGVITVLWADRVKGLQVLGADGGWHDVMPDPGALLINLGDVTARWTNEHWMSTLHRVKPPVIDGTIVRRRSVAYFHGCNWDATVAPLRELLAEGEAPLYAPISATEHFRAKLAGSRAGVLNPHAERESARVKSAR
ncbi:isopenicillin N synthase family oxygenase [Microbacterium enclense]|uniref:Isopenicillin N synthase family oxygenase n=1 Tax=Microbacterium enclense TaxID=993073 RepID=A0A3S3LIL6_9MICO|nr:2-oxoglutarate and iron-dependent oxygenase domain-containing protein [Microbacterium enclense]RWR17274.1 isopenicillin N synthase family oxygenase [Microbacterium enclense]